MTSTRSVAYGGETIHYEVLFVGSRATLGLEVHPDGRVVVRAPEGCAEQVVADRVQRRAGWISRKLAEFEQYRPRTPARQYLSGETHLYLGRQHRLEVREGPHAEVTLGRGVLRVLGPGPPDSGRTRELVRGWYRNRARSVFSEVLEEQLPRFEGSPRPRLVVRSMRTRWGSLSPSGTMSLNVDLVRAPRSCIEYVVVHELCHREHHDHGPQFYRLLTKILPDWKARKLRLEVALA